MAGKRFIYAPLRNGTPCVITDMSGCILYANQNVAKDDVLELAKLIRSGLKINLEKQ